MMKGIKMLLLTGLLSLCACSITDMVNPFNKPLLHANTAVQNGSNVGYDGSTSGKGNVARYNQQVVNGAGSVMIKQGVNPWPIIAILVGSLFAALFLLGLMIERPRRRPKS